MTADENQESLQSADAEGLSGERAVDAGGQHEHRREDGGRLEGDGHRQRHRLAVSAAAAGRLQVRLLAEKQDGLLEERQ
nr:MAG TPA: hypothetical protein [Caudoviricetes sp.]